MFLASRPAYRLTRIALLWAGAAVLPHGSAAQQPRAMPDSLTDREFWQFFTTMSEESGTFPSENFVSNEKTYQFVIPVLQRTLTPNGVYVGVGPEQNFTYIANLKPRMAVIFDIRRENAMMHLLYKALFELSPSRADFVARLFSRPLPASLARSATPAEIFTAADAAAVSDSAFDVNWKAIVDRLTITHGFALSSGDLAAMRHLFEAFREAGPEISYAFHRGSPPSPTQWLVTYAQLQSLTNADGVNMAFLATEANYEWLRAFQRRNMVVPVVADFAGPKAIRSVGEYLKQRGATVTAFYVSNVEQYLFTGFGSDQRFYRNVATLPIDSTSTFIRSFPGPNGIAGVLPPGAIATGPLTYTRMQVVDSAGVQIVTAAGVDSAGKPVTTRFVTSLSATTASSSAFISGVSPIARVLDVFVSGQLPTYAHVVALTKKDGWKPPP